LLKYAVDEDIGELLRELDPRLGLPYWIFSEINKITDPKCRSDALEHPLECAPSPPDINDIPPPPGGPHHLVPVETEHPSSFLRDVSKAAAEGAAIGALLASPTMIVPVGGEAAEAVAITGGAAVGGAAAGGKVIVKVVEKVAEKWIPKVFGGAG
jgi:hypothetical protein